MIQIRWTEVHEINARSFTCFDLTLLGPPRCLHTFRKIVPHKENQNELSRIKWESSLSPCVAQWALVRPSLTFYIGPLYPWAQKTWHDLSFLPRRRPHGPAWVHVSSRGADTGPRCATSASRESNAYKTIFGDYFNSKNS